VGKNAAMSRKPIPIGVVIMIVGRYGPLKPDLIIKFRPVPKSISPITVTQTHPEEGRGLKIFFS
jgi:hypothetical protein